MNAEKQKKTRTFGARVVDSLRMRVDRIHTRHLTSDAAVLEMCLEAFCDAVERTGKVDAPYRMIGAGEIFTPIPHTEPMAADGPQAPYTVTDVRDAQAVADKTHHEQVEAKYPRAKRRR